MRFLLVLMVLTTVLQSKNAYAKLSTPITVAKDGSGDYTTVQAAIDAVADSLKTETIIYIKNGIYKEKLMLTAKENEHPFYW